MRDTETKSFKGNNRQIIVIALFFLVLLAVQYFIRPDFGDDIVYARVWEEKPMGIFLAERYQNWSSRLLIEAIMIPLSAYPLIWRGLNIGIIMLLVWITADLFGSKDKLQAQVLFFLIMWMVPFYSLCNAGWIATTMNYLWCMVLGLVALRPIKHWLAEEKCPKWEYIVCPLCLLYAANMELTGAILLGVYLVFGTYLLVEKKKLSPFYIIQLVLIAASLCFILTAPGNKNRVLQETERFFPEFADMSFVQKVLMGFVDSCYFYISGGREKKCFVFPCLAGIILLCYMTSDRRKEFTEGVTKFLADLIAICPLIAYWCFAHFFRFLLEDVHIMHGRNLFGVFDQNGNIPGQSYFPDELVVLQIVVYLLVLLCVVLTIYFLHGKSKETMLQLLILAIGFASKLVMGFSPTIYASGERTTLFCTMAILIVVLRNIQLWLQKKHRAGWKMLTGMYVASMIICNIVCNIIK